MTNLSEAQIRAIDLKIKKIALEQGRGAMEMRTLFLLERATARLVLDTKLREHLIFKGGYVALRVYQSPRFTRDVDALIQGMSSEEAIARIRASMEIDIGDGAWFEFMGQENLKTQGDYGGVRTEFRAGVGLPPKPISKSLKLHIDLGIDDAVVPGPHTVNTNYEIGEGSISWKVYPIEVMIAEKIHALITLGKKNSRSKDIYDLSIFLPKADKEALKKAIHATFLHRKTDVPLKISDDLQASDTTVLKLGWASAIASIKSTVEFEVAFSNSILILKSLGL